LSVINKLQTALIAISM